MLTDVAQYRTERRRRSGGLGGKHRGDRRHRSTLRRPRRMGRMQCTQSMVPANALTSVSTRKARETCSSKPCLTATWVGRPHLTRECHELLSTTLQALTRRTNDLSYSLYLEAIIKAAFWCQNGQSSHIRIWIQPPRALCGFYGGRRHGPSSPLPHHFLDFLYRLEHSAPN